MANGRGSAVAAPIRFRSDFTADAPRSEAKRARDTNQARRLLAMLIIYDGVRVASHGGWWLLRASNTQPVLVGRCEAADADGLRHQIGEMTAQLRASGVAPPEIPAT